MKASLAELVNPLILLQHQAPSPSDLDLPADPPTLHTSDTALEAASAW